MRLTPRRLVARAVFLAALVLAPLTATAHAGTVAELNPPSSIDSMGDSITRGMNSGFVLGLQYTSLSWSTGDDGAVNSHRTRIKALRGGADPAQQNRAENGNKSTDLAAHVPEVIADKPEYVTILIGGNDVCAGDDPANMTSVATFRAKLMQTLNSLTSALPETRIFVGSVPDVYRMWEVGHTNSSARSRWSLYNVCQTLLANPESTAAADVSRRALVRQRARDYNGEIAQVCSAFIRCRYDGGAIGNTSFAISDLSGHDYFHPSAAGQAKLAATSWANGFNFTDKVAPVSTLTLSTLPAGAVDGWYPGTATVTVTATDAAGVKGSEYASRPSGAAGNPASWTRYLEPIAVSSEGSTEVQVRSVDVNGNTEASKTTTVKIDKTAPSISATATTADLYDGPVTLTIASSDAVSDVQSLGCTIDGEAVALSDVASGIKSRSGKVTVSGEGTREVVCTVADKAGNTKSITRTVSVDDTAPRLAIEPTPATEHDGWLTGTPLTVNVAAVDPNLDTAGCTLDGEDIALDTTDDGTLAGSVDIAGDGTYEVACTATDDAGHETSDARTFKVDATSPELEIAQEPDGDDGWFVTAPAVARVSATDPQLSALECTLDGTPVVLDTTATDGGLTASVSVSDDGEHALACTAADRAGHTVSDAADLRLDSADPAVAITQAPDGDDGWFVTGPAVAHVTATDVNASSLACTVGGEAADLTTSTTTAGLEADVPVSSDGVHALACTAEDVAGNSAGDSATVKLDTTDPAVALTGDADGAGGWFTSPDTKIGVDASDAHLDDVSCTDGGVDVTVDDAPDDSDLAGLIAIAADGRHALECSATDDAGNTTDASRTVNADYGKPAAPAAAADRAPDVDGWYRDRADVTFTAAGDPALADTTAGSGIDASSLTPQSVLVTSGTHTVDGSVADVAGNRSDAASLTVKVDADQPTVSVACPPSTLVTGTTAHAVAKAADAHSGLAEDPSGFIALDTASAGTRVATVRATDRVGHRATASCEYTVRTPDAPAQSPATADSSSPAGGQAPRASGPAGTASSTAVIRTRVVYGRTVVIRGRLSSAASGVPVSLVGADYPSRAWKPMTTVRTGAGGAYRFRVTPKRNERYLVLTGAPQTTLAEHLVLVTPKVTLRRGAVSDGKTRLSGVVTPGVAGRTVAIQRKTGAGWKTIATAALGKAKNGSARYSVRVRLPASGALRARFSVPGLTAGASRTTQR